MGNTHQKANFAAILSTFRHGDDNEPTPLKLKHPHLSKTARTRSRRLDRRKSQARRIMSIKLQPRETGER